MKTFTKAIIYCIPLLFLLTGILGWKHNFETPFWDHRTYIGIGILSGLVAFLVFFLGRVIAPFLFLGSLLPIAWIIVSFIFFRGATWSSIHGNTCILIFVIGATVSLLLYGLGSEAVEQSFLEEYESSERKVVCSACKHYLGKAKNFKTPCPNCGGNKYEIESK